MMVQIVEIHVATLEVAELRNGRHGAHDDPRLCDSSGATIGESNQTRQTNSRTRVD